MASKHFSIRPSIKSKSKSKSSYTLFKSRTIKYSATEQKANVTTIIPYPNKLM